MAGRKLPLTPRRQRMAAPRDTGLFVGAPLAYPAAPAMRYGQALLRLVDVMRREYDRDIRALFREYGPVTFDASLSSQARIALNKLQDRFARMFRRAAGPLVDRIFGQVDKASMTSVQTSLKELSGGLTIPVPSMPADLAEVVTAKTAENVALIRSIPAQYHERIAGVLLRSIQPGGEGLAEVDAALQQYGDVTARRASFIAQDQTRKLTTAMNSARVQAAGCKKFRWRHSAGGAEPRELHLRRLNGRVFEYANPPIIDERTGERGLPGQLPNCRCVAIPVLEFEDAS